MKETDFVKQIATARQGLAELPKLGKSPPAIVRWAGHAGVLVLVQIVIGSTRANFREEFSRRSAMKQLGTQPFFQLFSRVVTFESTRCRCAAALVTPPKSTTALKICKA